MKAENRNTSPPMSFSTSVRTDSFQEVAYDSGSCQGFDQGQSTRKSTTLPRQAAASTLISVCSVGCCPFHAFCQSKAYTGVNLGVVSGH